MADNKANTLHPPQSLNSQTVTGTLPVKAYVYRAIAEMNAGFEKVVQDLNNLKQIAFFRSDPLREMHDTLCAIRARANREFIAVLEQRELANATHFERLCGEREPVPFPSPADGAPETPPNE
jgi:hypothetical protein